MTQELALFCILHPASVEKKKRVLSLLNSSKPYYQTPSSKCTTWSYFTPSTQLNIASDLVRPAEHDTLVAGLEIYTDKSALGIQTESTMYKAFHAAVQTEQLYSRAEELVAWYPVAGFVSRGETADPFGRGVFVLTAVHVCKDGQRDRVVDILSEYASFVKHNEPGFLTYSVMVRPKAPDEVLVFERCTGPGVLQDHVATPVFRKAIKAALLYIKTPKGQEWTELDNAFVGNVVGGKQSPASSKL